MRDQTARDPKFPVACARCGGRISEPVAFCPHCGAHARFALAGAASPARHGSAASTRAEPSVRSYESSDFEGDLDPPWPGPPTPLFASPDGDPYGDVRAPALRGSRQWSLKGGTALILGAFVVIYGSAVLLHRYDQAAPSPIPRDSAAKSVEGSIASNGGAGDIAAPVAAPRGANGGLQAPAPMARQAAPGSTDRSAATDAAPPTANKADDSTPIASLPPPVASNAPPVAPVQTQPSAPANSTQAYAPNDALGQSAPSGGAAATNDSAQARAGRRAVAANDRAPAADTSAARVKAQAQAQSQALDAKTGRAAAARQLDGVQARLAKNDLRGARASLSSVLASDPHNGYALSLRDQLVSREQARDASLNAARACVVQARWNCVWHNAGSALSVDASSREAKALVDRAIIESGAATAPAGPGPDNVQVPMVQ